MHVDKRIISGRYFERPLARHSAPTFESQPQSKFSQFNPLDDQNIPANRLTLTQIRDCAAATVCALTVFSLHGKIAEHTPPKYKNHIHISFLVLSCMAFIFLLKNKTRDQPANEVDHLK
jgi:hypothetical protein